MDQIAEELRRLDINQQRIMEHLSLPPQGDQKTSYKAVTFLYFNYMLGLRLRKYISDRSVTITIGILDLKPFSVLPHSI